MFCTMCARTSWPTQMMYWSQVNMVSQTEREWEVRVDQPWPVTDQSLTRQCHHTLLVQSSHFNGAICDLKVSSVHPCILQHWEESHTEALLTTGLLSRVQSWCEAMVTPWGNNGVVLRGHAPPMGWQWNWSWCYKGERWIANTNLPICLFKTFLYKPDVPIFIIKR